MTQTITRLYDSRAEAQRAVEALEAAGVDSDRISLISSNADDAWGRHGHEAAEDAADGAAKGAAAGGVIGGGAGLLAGLGLLAIPGLGPVVAAGWLVSAVALGAAGAAAGGAAGGATGGILGALKDAGHSDEDAHVYAEGVRRGGAIVSVRVYADDAQRIRGMLDSGRSVDLSSRADAYRSAGWTGFDEQAPAYGADDAAAERARRAEVRSFREDPSREDIAEERGAGGGAGGIATPIPGVDN